MESNEIMQSELNQTATDLLLQESIQTNQKLEDLQNLLISIKDLRIILPESIKNVMFEQLKKQQDLQENSLKQSSEELQKSKNLHNLQLNEMKTEMNKKITEYQKETSIQLEKLKDQSQTIIRGECKNLFSNSEKSICEIIDKSTSNLKTAIKNAKKMMTKNLIFNFLSSLILLAAAIGGYLYIQNYRAGIKIAEAKAVESLAKERSKIEQNAVSTYKESDLYTEEACKYVASNISRLKCIHYMYVYIKSDDIKKYPEVKAFYNDFLAEGHKEYKGKK